MISATASVQHSFAAPANFPEFNKRFPDHVRNFVCGQVNGDSAADIEGTVNRLSLYLMSVPSLSVHGQPCSATDRIGLFHPDQAHGGATRSRFLYFIDRMLLNTLLADQRAHLTSTC